MCGGCSSLCGILAWKLSLPTSASLLNCPQDRCFVCLAGGLNCWDGIGKVNSRLIQLSKVSWAWWGPDPAGCLALGFWRTADLPLMSTCRISRRVMAFPRGARHTRRRRWVVTILLKQRQRGNMELLSPRKLINQSDASKYACNLGCRTRSS